ncbi:OsmC family protein [Spirosoma sp. BT702]|uniref:OsmC family protein n=1 Tax=Spirosoma profusum TaxID=2771354 RepID=A0A927GB56_9BACT|nr:OsmC family protein [Spirosoma profusum]
MKRSAQAVWLGTGREGSGTLSATSDVLNQTPYSFNARFQNEDGKAGTNPEELMAAAHAGCYAMQLSFLLTGAGFSPTALQTRATVELVEDGAGFKLSGIALALEGQVTSISTEQFAQLATEAKQICPLLKALSAVPITLEAKLIPPA